MRSHHVNISPPTARLKKSVMTNRRSSWLTVFRWSIAVLVLLAIGYTVRNVANQFKAHDFQLASIDYPILALSIVCYILAMLLSCCFWKLVLKRFGCHPSWNRTLLAFFLSQLGKYVPGKALVIVIRTDAIRDSQTGAGLAAASVFVETLTWIFVGSVIACLLTAIQFSQHPAMLWTAAILAGMAGVVTLPPVFRYLAIRLTRTTDPQVFAQLDFGTMAQGWLLMSLGWCLNGLSLWLVLFSLPHTDITLTDYPLCLACVSLATVAGFASLLPGGIGVRELVLIPLLGPRFGSATAVIAAVLIRIVWLSAELFTTGIIYLTSRPQPTNPRLSD